jgi:hypothetical protein
VNGHDMTITENLEAHENTIRAGFNHRASCSCGWKQVGQRVGVGKLAARHLEKAEYLSFRGTR